MQKSTTNNILAILVSVGIHALLLLIPWQPAQVIELLPLEGTGVVELAELQQVKGEPDDAIEQDALPQEEPKPPVTEEVKKPEPVKPPETTAQTSTKPIISIKPIVEKPVAQVVDELVTSPAGSVAVQTEPVDATDAADAPATPQPEPQQEPEPVKPAFPGDDPTGEAMVASKREVAYPKESQSSSSEGDVIVEVRIGTDGKILTTGILSGPDDEWLKKNAELTILKYWTFKSAERPYKVVIEVSFRMQPVARTEQRFISASFLD